MKGEGGWPNSRWMLGVSIPQRLSDAAPHLAIMAMTSTERDNDVLDCDGAI